MPRNDIALPYPPLSATGATLDNMQKHILNLCRVAGRGANRIPHPSDMYRHLLKLQINQIFF